MLVQAPVATAPELPSLAPNGGAFASVIVVSPQGLLATEWASEPVDCALLAQPRRVAAVTVPLAPVTLKRKNERTTGEPSTRIVVAVPWFVVGAEASV